MKKAVKCICVLLTGNVTVYMLWQCVAYFMLVILDIATSITST